MPNLTEQEIAITIPTRVVVAVLAIATNWNFAEVRPGRGSDHLTTGAQSEQIRELSADEIDSVQAVCGAFGIDVDDDELREFFSGEYRYQGSFSVNRFETAARRGGQRLTQNELRTLERAKLILGRKERAAASFLSQPEKVA